MPALHGVTKHTRTPTRTCVACRETMAKSSLVRIVKTPRGAVAMDPTGKSPGRGVYLCHNPQCWETALKKKRIDHALKTEVPLKDKTNLAEVAKTMFVNHMHTPTTLSGGDGS